MCKRARGGKLLDYVKTVRPDILEKRFWKKILFLRIFDKRKFIEAQASFITQLENLNSFRMGLMSEMIDHKNDRNEQLDLYLRVGSPKLIEKHEIR